MAKVSKSFDCVEMKRRIQQRIYEDTKGMTGAEFAEYMRQRIASSPFASFLDRPASNAAPELQDDSA